jgi:hypothetical protein
MPIPVGGWRVTSQKLLEDAAADLAWKVAHALVGSQVYKDCLRALNRAYSDGHADGRVFESGMHRGVEKQESAKALDPEKR